MKRIIILTSLAITLLGAVDFTCGKSTKLGLPVYHGRITPDKFICHTGYLSAYSYKLKQPLYTIYYITRSDAIKRLPRYKYEDFRIDQDIPKKYSQSPDCYYKSGFDRGHLTPYWTQDYSKRTASESFYMTNVVPQTPHFNRVTWRRVEIKVYNLLNKYHSLIIITGQIPNPNYKDSLNQCCNLSYSLLYYKVVFDSQGKFVTAIISQVKNKLIDNGYVTYNVDLIKASKILNMDFSSMLISK